MFKNKGFAAAMLAFCMALLVLTGSLAQEAEIYDPPVPFYASITTYDEMNPGGVVLVSPNPNEPSWDYMFVNNTHAGDVPVEWEHDVVCDVEIRNSMMLEFQAGSEIYIPADVEDIELLMIDNVTSLDLSSARSLKTVQLMGAYNLKTLEIPYGVEAVMLNHTTALTSLKLPSTVKFMEIWHCDSLTKLDIPEGVEYLAVRDCAKLKSLTLPKSVKKVFTYAFAGSSGLQSITIYGDPETNFMNGIGPFRGSRPTVYMANPDSENAQAWKSHNINVQPIGDVYDVDFNCQYDGRIIEASAAAGKLVKEPGFTARLGYVFTGWYKDSACTQKWNFGSDKMPSSDLTLYAGWEKQTEITFELYPGMQMPPKYALAGEQIEQPQDPFRDGYQFTGWYKDRQHTQPWLFASDVAGTNDMTLYAGWKPVFAAGLTFENDQVVMGRIVGDEKSVTIPEQYGNYIITALGSNSVPAHVEELTLSSHIESIDPWAFSSAASLKKINVSEQNEYFYSLDGVLYTADHQLVCYPRSKEGTTFAVPAGTTAVKARAFEKLNHLLNVSIPSSVTKLERCAFVSCKSLTGITFEADVADLAERAVRLCSSVTLYAPDTATNLKTRAQNENIQFNAPAVLFVSEGRRLEKRTVAVGQLIGVAPEVSAEYKQFQGWSTEENGLLWNLESDVMPEKSITLYAVWEDDFKYEIADGKMVITGYNHIAQRQLVPEELYGYEVASIAKDAFKGYTGTLIGKPNGLVQQYAQAEGLKFEATQYLLSFVTNCDTALEARMVDTGSKLSLPMGDGLVKSGYYLSGWYSDESLTQPVSSGTPMPAHDLTLYASWLPSAAGMNFVYEKYEQDGTTYVRILRYIGTAVNPAIPTRLEGYEVREVADYAFSGTNITHFLAEYGTLRYIGEYAFQNCTSLETVTLPQNLTAVSKGMFEGCTALESLFIPAAAEKVDFTAFDGCTTLRKIAVDMNHPNYSFHRDSNTDTSAVYDKEQKTLLYASPYMWWDYTPPQTLETIASGAFVNSPVTQFYAQATNLKTIETGAFVNCQRLGTVQLPETLETVEDYAFTNCPMMGLGHGYAYSGSLPAALRYVGSKAFDNASFGALTIPEDTVLADDAFVVTGWLSVYGAEDSSAHEWALANGVPFNPESSGGDFISGNIKSIANRTLYLNIGESETIQCTMDPEYPLTRDDLLWESLSPHVAHVDENGTVTALNEGTATIQINRPGGDALEECYVMVTRESIPVEGLQLVPSALILAPDDTAVLQTVMLPANAQQTAPKLTWETSDPSVVTCVNGVITAVGGGEAVVTAKAANGMSAQCSVTVYQNVLRLPSDLVQVMDNAFAGAAFECVVTSNNLEKIGKEAFADCADMQIIRLESSVQEIAEDAFKNCSALTIHAPEGSYAIEWAKEHEVPCEIK